MIAGMAVSKGFTDFVVEQLDGCGLITAKRMFGGVGLYRDDVFFAIIADDVLYLKVGDKNRVDYERAKCERFHPHGDDRASLSYYSVPVSVLEDPRELTMWAKKSIAVATAWNAQPRRGKPAEKERHA